MGGNDLLGSLHRKLREGRGQRWRRSTGRSYRLLPSHREEGGRAKRPVRNVCGRHSVEVRYPQVSGNLPGALETATCRSSLCRIQGKHGWKCGRRRCDLLKLRKVTRWDHCQTMVLRLGRGTKETLQTIEWAPRKRRSEKCRKPPGKKQAIRRGSVGWNATRERHRTGGGRFAKKGWRGGQR